MRHAALTIALILAACGGQETDARVVVKEQTVETRPPNAAYQPLLPGQTRAPLRTANVAFDVVTVARGLERPWGLDFLPGGGIVVTEREGRMRIVGPDGALSEPVNGLPEVDVGGQGGLLDVALSPTYAADGLVYWSYSQPRPNGNGTAVARGRLVTGPEPALTNVQVIWAQTPAISSSQHFGSRLVFTPDGKLFITTGDRSVMAGRVLARKLDNTVGKVIRINPDGSIPADNPHAKTAGAKLEIWSAGHRNIQGAALHPSTGELWTVEHGPRGGDELNVALAGKDYGWPTITYGLEYSGQRVGQGITRADGLEQPVYYWDPIIAPAGIAFYTADLFPAWKGSLFVSGMKPGHLARLTLDGYRVTGEERLLEDLGERIRDVNVGPDGALYILTDENDGRILKLVPR